MAFGSGWTALICIDPNNNTNNNNNNNNNNNINNNYYNYNNNNNNYKVNDLSLNIGKYVTIWSRDLELIEKNKFNAVKMEFLSSNILFSISQNFFLFICF